MSDERLLETWRIHARIDLYILDAISDEAFSAAPPKKGRSFDQMFAHIHNVRLMWLQAGAPQMLAGLSKIQRTDPVDKTLLKSALAASAQAMESLLAGALASGGRVKGFRPHAEAFLGYLIAHEAYHHGEIGLAVAELGYPLDKKVAFGMWEWGVR